MNMFTACRQFFEQLQKQLPSEKVVCFRSELYPLLFFSQLLTFLQKKYSFQVIDVSVISRQQALSVLETSFLGMNTGYWLRNISALSMQEQSFWLSYCARYAGPHIIMFFTTTDKKKEHIFPIDIDIPVSIKESEWIHMASFFEEPISFQQKMHIKKICAYQESIPLDTACLLSAYIPLLSCNEDLFVTELLPLIIAPTTSLFALSSSFLSKKSTQFYPLWQQVHARYSEQFWCTFFSDLLWRGAQYIRLAQANQMAAARAMTYGLPFSFTKSEWRSIQQHELIAAHESIYAIDFASKNGAGYGAFDLFFSSFFLNTFV